MNKPLSIQDVRQAINPNTLPNYVRGTQAVVLRHRDLVDDIMRNPGESAEKIFLLAQKLPTPQGRQPDAPAVIKAKVQQVLDIVQRLPNKSLTGNFTEATKLYAQATQAVKTVYRKDYAPPPFGVDHVDLHFALDKKETVVTCTSKVKRTADGKGQSLVLDGDEHLDLRSVAVNGRQLASHEYAVLNDRLIIHTVPDAFELSIQTAISPENNTTGLGLYEANGVLLTQNEAHGMRRIVYCVDRTDVMSTYTTTIEADKATYPTILSNGNPVKTAELPGGRHSATIEDPFPKPTQLFALAAGKFDVLEDEYVTSPSNRRVKLEVYVDPGDKEKGRFALEALKLAMRWDEEHFGLECDLDRYAIVVTQFFNFGAMENKGLNVFNASYALADPRTATDADYENIAAVIAHEYFHNWTGNRVGILNPFQITLKEGATSLRDQLFSESMGAHYLNRIAQVSSLRASQFNEDASPQAHSVVPHRYASIDNLYSATVYDKGAEVDRMLMTLVGARTFKEGVNRFCQKYDGQAVTVKELVDTIAEHAGMDATQFARWYDQVGTPTVRISQQYDPQKKSLTVTMQQDPKESDGPLHIPMRVGLIGSKGPIGEERLLELKSTKQTFVFENVEENPVLSVNRGFTAPVHIELKRSPEQFRQLMAHDVDLVARWDAKEELATQLLTDMAKAYRAHGDATHGLAKSMDGYAEALREVLNDPHADAGVKAHMLGIRASDLKNRLPYWDFEAMKAATDALSQHLANKLQQEFEDLWNTHQPPKGETYSPVPNQVKRRALHGAALDYRVEAQKDNIVTDKPYAAGNNQALDDLMEQYHAGRNMTERMNALGIAVDLGGTLADELLAHFYEMFKDDTLVVGEWFGLQAGMKDKGSLDRVKRLLKHEAYNEKNPNLVRGLLGSFARNGIVFHAADGSGYEFMADQIIHMNGINPKVAASLARAFLQWRKMDKPRQELMKAQLQRIRETPKLGTDVLDIVSNALKA